MASDYDKLIKEGYKEQEINTKISNISSVRLTSDPLAPGRTDMAASLVSNTGEVRRSSNIMTGYQASLPCGDLVSLEELEEALEKSLTKQINNSQKKKVIIARYSGKKVDVKEVASLVVKVLENRARLKITGLNSKFEHQTAYNFKMGSLDGKERVLLTSRDGIKLPYGGYVTLEEIEKALRNYVILVEGQNKPKLPRPRPVLHIDKKKGTIALSATALALAITTLLSGFKMANEEIENIGEKKIQVADIGMEQVVEDEVYNQLKQFNGYSLGDAVTVPDGVVYHESSDELGKRFVIGEKNNLRPSGEYNIEYMSFLDSDNNIIYVERESGKSVDEAFHDTIQNYNLNVDDIHVMFHIQDTGWVSLDELLKCSPEDINKDTINKLFAGIQAHQENFEGKVEFKNFDGQDAYITLNEVNVGDVVRASDGNLYMMEYINVEEKTVDVVDVSHHKKLTWSIANIVEHSKQATFKAIYTAELLGGLATTMAVAISKEKENNRGR